MTLETRILMLQRKLGDRKQFSLRLKHLQEHPRLLWLITSMFRNCLGHKPEILLQGQETHHLGEQVGHAVQLIMFFQRITLLGELQVTLLLAVIPLGQLLA
jgi:hypothetical protein